MKKTRILAVVVCVLAAANFASADTIRGIGIDFVTIGNPGNIGDTRAEANPYGCGAVSSSYRIGKYEVTATQWQTINTAAGIGNPGTWSGNQPAASISWYDAARFCNYLTTGNTEDGVYKFSGGLLTDIMGHEQAGSTYGIAYFLPTEDEWYKAAYYKPNGSGYSLYANGLSTIPAPDNGWNYTGGAYDAPWNVGTGGIAEQNGTFDMMGNVWEWNETLFYGPCRGVRGASCFSFDRYIRSSDRADVSPDLEDYGIGFRVAEIPEPATILLLTLGGLALRLRSGQALRKYRK